MMIRDVVCVAVSPAAAGPFSLLGLKLTLAINIDSLKFGELFFSFKLRKASRQGQLRTLTRQVEALAQTRAEVALRERRPEWRGYEQYFRPDDFLFHNSSKSDELF